MNSLLPKKKKELTEKQELFLTELMANGGNITQAIETAGYSQESRSWLVSSVKDEIIDRTKTLMASSSMKAANRLLQALDHDGTIPTSQMDTRIRAANEILDRTGITKKQEIDVKGQMLHGVVMLPAKQDIEGAI